MDTPPPPPPLPTQPAPAPAPTPPRRGWWSRNWKWFVPLGCLGTIAVGVVFVLAIVGFVFGVMKTSEPYKFAVARAQADTRVQEALGTPVKTGAIVSGSTNDSGGTGKADLSIPLSGPKGAGTLYVVGEKSGGQWTYSKLTVQVNGGAAIDLNSESEE